MSGPVTAQDAAPDPAAGRPHAPEVEVLPSRETTVGGVPVRRALPKRQRRTVGAWCFADHFGPVAAGGGAQDMQIGPHPHSGLHTVTWLVEGELVHRDSLGSEQPIRPGQLNLMTAGHGVAHAEESPPALAGRQHGIQLWVAQPEATRHGPAAFEHHAELPRLDLGGAVATVLVGGLDGLAGADSRRGATPRCSASTSMPAGGAGPWRSRSGPATSTPWSCSPAAWRWAARPGRGRAATGSRRACSPTWARAGTSWRSTWRRAPG